MKLLARSTRPDDLVRCSDLLLDRFLYDDAAIRDLQAMWLEILTRDIGRSAVVFDAAEPQRVLAFGISAAVSEARFDAIFAAGAPFIGKTLLEEWRSGHTPFLDEAALGSASAGGGLHLVVTHNGIANLDVPGFFPMALSAMSEGFMTQHVGGNLNAYVHEAFGVPRAFAHDTGMYVTEYGSEHVASLDAIPPGKEPIVVSMSRAQAREHPGNLLMYQLFLNFTPPRCGLRAEQRRLLRLALEGTPDERIAGVLQIASRTLKKRWADIYAAMEPATGVFSGLGNGQRGAEIRRHVLRYVREHPEELHAYANA